MAAGPASTHPEVAKHVTQLVLVGVAGGFAVVTGANDGSAMLSTGLRSTGMSPLTALLVLMTTLVVAPLLFGTRVAATFTGRLISFHGAAGQVALVVGVLSALLVVLLLTWRGLPTSLTMAVVGGLAGAGAGLGLHVSWASVATVLLVGMAAPVVGGVAGFVLARLTVWLPAGRGVRTSARLLHPAAFVLQCFAYAANDGQKMLAIFAVALGANELAGDAGDELPLLLAIVVLFGIGVLVSLRRMAGTLGGQIVAFRSVQILSAEVAAAAAVMGSAAVGMPVSMTQSVAAGLVGAGASEGARRVRWRAASRIVLAWVITVPASLLLAVVAAGLVRWAG